LKPWEIAPEVSEQDDEKGRATVGGHVRCKPQYPPPLTRGPFLPCLTCITGTIGHGTRLSLAHFLASAASWHLVQDSCQGPYPRSAEPTTPFGHGQLMLQRRLLCENTKNDCQHNYNGRGRRVTIRSVLEQRDVPIRSVPALAGKERGRYCKR